MYRNLVVVLNKLLSLLDTAVQFGNSCLQQVLKLNFKNISFSFKNICNESKKYFGSYLLEGCECAEAEVLGDAVGSEHQGGGEVLGLGDVGLDVGALHHALLSVHTLDQAVREPENM